jgi:hypothetical protein
VGGKGNYQGLALRGNRGAVERMKGYDVDVLRKIFLESIFLRCFDGCLAGDDGTDFGCYIKFPQSVSRRG